MADKCTTKLSDIKHAYSFDAQQETDTAVFLLLGDDDDEEDAAKKEEREKKRQEEDESLFHRLEESRLMLEQELGFDKFLRVYRYLQVGTQLFKVIKIFAIKRRHCVIDINRFYHRLRVVSYFGKQ